MQIYIESITHNHIKYQRLKTNNLILPLIVLSPIFNSLIKSLNLLNEPNYDSRVTLDYEEELTRVFCSTLNSTLGFKFCQVGNSTDCIFSFRQSSYNTLMSALNTIEGESLSDEFSKNLLNEIEENTLKLDFPMKNYFKDKLGNNDYVAFSHVLDLRNNYNKYIYSNLLFKLLMNGKGDVNHPIPCFYNFYIKKFEFIEPIDNIIDFNNVVYPLDLAVNSNNKEFLIWLLRNGANKFEDKRNSTSLAITKFVTYLLKNCGKDGFRLAFNLLDQNEEDYKWLFKVAHSPSATSWIGDEYISSDGESILLEAYKNALYSNDIESLRELMKRHRYWLMKVLQHKNIYYPKTYVNDTPPNLTEQMISYIKENIAVYIDGYKNYDPHEHGIWGYNAVTGRPITFEQLKDIDSQR